MIKPLFVISAYEMTLLAQFEIDDINSENSQLAEAGIQSKLEKPNSEARISSENGDKVMFFASIIAIFVSYLSRREEI